MTAKTELLGRVAAILRTTDPAKAAALAAAIAEVEAGKRDVATIGVTMDYRIEKFDGEATPGKVPVEVITGRENLLTGEPA